MKEPVSEAWLTDEALRIAGSLLDAHMERDASVVHQLVRRLRQQSAERDKWHSDAVTQMKHKIRLEDELAKLLARINDLHDVPPEHESEPPAFHKGWELAMRAVAR